MKLWYRWARAQSIIKFDNKKSKQMKIKEKNLWTIMAIFIRIRIQRKMNKVFGKFMRFKICIWLCNNLIMFLYKLFKNDKNKLWSVFYLLLFYCHFECIEHRYLCVCGGVWSVAYCLCVCSSWCYLMSIMCAWRFCFYFIVSDEFFPTPDSKQFTVFIHSSGHSPIAMCRID